MDVNSHKLPHALVERVVRGPRARKRGSWHLRADCDCFGAPLETELAQFMDFAEMEATTRDLLSNFPPGPNEFAVGPSAIPDPKGFAEIVAFAISGDGAYFCLDYRASAEPSVIWWDDTHWKRVAPSFQDFLGLFDLQMD
ncbi:MAG: SMI1/KNR4 family protein [Polyangiaceae bacterium]